MKRTRSLFWHSLIGLSLVVNLSGTLSAAAQERLKVDVFTSGPEGFLVTSTLVSGPKEAVLIDAQFTLPEAHRLTARVLESGKRLKAIFITHGHPDHFFGLEVLARAFPEAKLLTTPAVLAEMRRITPSKLAQWKPLYGDLLTSSPLFPQATRATHLEVDGERLELVPLSAAESESATAVWIPAAQTLVAGDAAYQDVHVYLVETNAERRSAWQQNLARLRSFPAKRVVAGHQASTSAEGAVALEETARYLRDFDAALATSNTPEALIERMLAKHGRRQLPIILELSAKSQELGKR